MHARQWRQHQEVLMTASGAQSSGSTSTPRDRAHNMAGQMVDKVQETASRLIGSSQGGEGSSGSQDGGVTGPVMDKAAEQVTSRLDMGRDYVVETMTGVAQALRQTGQHLREEAAQPMLAGYAERGAEQVERLGGYLRQRDASQLMTEMESFARRQPMVFSGAAFALGMLAVRFFRSEAPPQRPSTSTPGSRPYGASSMATGSAGTWSQGRPATTSTAASTSMPSSGFTGTSPSTMNRPSSTPSTGGSTGTQTP